MTDATKNLADGTYTFTITGPNDYTSEQTITITNGQSNKVQVYDLAPGTYTVSEDTTKNPEGMALVGENDIEVVVEAGATAEVKTAEFTNNINTGDLEVSKTTSSAATADANKAFLFTVVLSDKTITGTYGGMTFNNGEASFSLKSGESKKAEGLPEGITYTVTESEEGAAGFTTTVKDASAHESDGRVAQGTISKDTPAKADFTNTRDLGGFSVKKTVSSEARADMTKEFQFTATLVGESGINGKYGDLNFVNGVATFSLTSGQTISASGLPIGVGVEIKEASAAGFVVTPQGGVITGSVTNPISEFNFTNTKDQGGLIVSKTVASPVPGDLTKEFDFTVTITKENGETDTTVNGTYGDMSFTNGVASFKLISGQTKEAKGLPKGAHYKVEEAADGQFVTKYTGETGVISDTTAQAGFTNTRKTGDLEVSKALVSDAAADANQVFTFSIELTGVDFGNGDKVVYGGVEFNKVTEGNGAVKGVGQVTITGQGSKTIKGIPTGVTYKVTEATIDGKPFTVAYDNAEGQIKEGTTTAAVTNTRKTGSLELSKKLVSKFAADADAVFKFHVKLTGLKADGENAEKTFSGVKFVNGEADVELKGGESKTIEGLPIGVDYVVTEVEIDGSAFDVAYDAAAQGVITQNGVKTEITNTRKTGKLTLSKTLLTDVAADSNQEFSFTVQLAGLDTSGDEASRTFSGVTFDADGKATVRLKGGASKTIEGLPVGVTYAITEQSVAGFQQTAKVGDEGTIQATPSEATFTNTREGGLIISKEILSGSTTSDANKEFTFVVQLADETISGSYSAIRTHGETVAPVTLNFIKGKAEIALKGGDTCKILGLPYNLGYTVIEKGASADEFVNGFKLTGKTGDSGVVTSEPLAAAAFINARETGSLEVSKQLFSDYAADADTPFTFTVTLNDSSINGTYGDASEGAENKPMTFVDGKATFTLKGGEKAVATGLPTGVGYSVVEARAVEGDNGYEPFVVTYDGNQEGTISANGAATVVTNTRKTGDLKISKRLVSRASADAGQTFTFNVQLTGVKTDEANPVKATYSGVEFTNGVATITLNANDEKVIQGLPVGVGYTVTEVVGENSPYTTKVNGDAGVVASGNIAENTQEGAATSIAAFENTRKTGDLEVSKALVSAAAADKDQVFSFTVELTGVDFGDGDKATFDGVEFTKRGEKGVATIELKGGAKKEIKGLPVGVGYSVTEGTVNGEPFTVAYDDNASGTIAEGKASTTITNTRKTGDLEISKAVVSAAAADASQTFTFEIVVSGLDAASRSFASTVKTGDAESTAADNVVFDESGKATIELVGGQSRTIKGLPIGVSYTVKEASHDGFTTKVNGQEGAEATGTISEGTASASFENTRKTGGFSVTKTTVSSTGSDKTIEFNFSATLSDKTINGTYGGMTFENGVAAFALHDGQTVSAENLPTGITYTVVETDADANGFVTTKSGDTGTIGETVSIATFTNTKQEGGLIVSKSVQSDVAADHTAEYSFKVTLGDTTINGVYGGEDGMSFKDGVAEFTLTDAQAKSATGLPAGITYTVEEQLGANAPFTVTKSGDTGTIEKSEVSSAAFANARKTGDLEISKAVVSDVPADKTQKFQFGISLINKTTNEAEAVNGDYAIDGTDRTVTFKDGAAAIELSDNETVKIKGLPAGLKYSVTEALDESGPLAMTATGNDGEIEAGESKTAAFTNTREVGNLSVSKTLISTANAGADQVFTFTVKLTDTPINANYKLLDKNGQELEGETAAFANGVATIGLKGGETKTIVGLPANVAYEISEGDFTDQGYVLGEDQPGASGTISSDSTPVAQFTNTRTEVTAQLYAYKELQGAKSLKPDEFTFQLLDENNKQIDEKKNNGTRYASFKTLTFGVEDIGEHVYTIKEVKGDKPYITYDESEHKIKITVSKNEGDGTLQVSYEPMANGDERFIAPAEPTTEGAVQEGSAAGAGVKFVNTYSSSGEFQLVTKKTVDGGKVPEADAGKYTFAVYKTNASGDIEENAEPVATATNDANGDVKFASMESDSADTKYYLIKEVIPEGAKKIGSKWVKDGVAYDQGTSLATVTGVDNEDGTITFTVTYDGGAEGSKVFNNTTVANATFDLNVQKVIEGRDFKDGDTFTFTVEPADEGANIPMPNPATATIAPKSGTTAKVEFGPITFTADNFDPDATNGSANTFRYLVKETPGQANDVLYDQDAHLVTVTLSVGENDELVATAEYDKDADGADVPVTLTNVSWKGSVDLHFNKYHFGENKRPFNFLLTAVDSNGDARTSDNQPVAYGSGSAIIDNGVDPFTIAVTNDDFDGNKASIDFPKIAYQEKGDYYYLVRENEASVNGMIADEAQYLVHVSVAEDGTATPTYTLIYDDVKEEVTEGNLDFYNNSAVTLGFNSLSAQSYADGELVRVYPEAEKLLDNEAAKLRGNDFSFQLIDNASGEVITTVSNDENGKVAFFDEKAGDPGLVYDAVGEYKYTIREVVPEGAVNNVKDGVTYDTNTYTLTVTVTETATEAGNALVATTKYDGAKLDSKTGIPVFTNTEQATDVVIQKVSRVGGEGLEGATYALFMVGANGDALIQEAVSDARGYITFENVTLLPGQQYYFKEVEAPEGHTVDPYRTGYFTPDATCTKLVPSAGSTADGWHSAKEG